MKSKWNWGKGILVFISGFVLLKVILVFIAVGQKVDMVTDNYYEKDLKYQEEITRQQNVLELDDKVSITFSNNNLTIILPGFETAREFNGSINFYRPSDSDLDRQSALSVDETGKQTFDLTSFQKGVWKIQLKWNYDKKEFSYQQMIYI